MAQKKSNTSAKKTTTTAKKSVTKPVVQPKPALTPIEERMLSGLEKVIIFDSLVSFIADGSAACITSPMWQR